MKHQFILWTAAIVITYLTGYLHSISSSSYPISGTIGIEGKKVSYFFDREFSSSKDYRIVIRTDTEGLDGKIFWKRENENRWNESPLKDTINALIGYIPHQEALTNINYYAKVYYKDKEYRLPKTKTITMLFLGEVPASISITFYLVLFGGLLLSTRTGLEYFNENQKIKKLSLFTAAFFFVYFIALTPFKRTLELDAINKSVPTITALFNFHSLLLLFVWVAAVIVLFKVKNPKPIALAAAITTILIFLFVRI